MDGVLIRALEAGMEMEKRGEAFYSKAAGEVENPHGKLTLNFLAGEERQHYRFLEALLESVKKGLRPEAPPLPKRPRLKREEILEAMRQMGVKARAARRDREIVGEAMKVEEKSIEFYEGFLGEAGDAKSREIFKELVEEERRHLEWLEFIRDALEVHGYWYDLESYFALEGF
jgi:rubrerythrin